MENNNIELRSEKIRNVVGKMPSLLQRRGIVIITGVLFILILILAFLPYKEILPIKLMQYSTPAIETLKTPVAGMVFLEKEYEIVYANQTIGHVLSDGKLIPVRASITGIPLFHVSDCDQVKAGSILLIIIPKESRITYGEAEIPIEQKTKINLNNKVVLYSSQGNRKYYGRLSKIYPIHSIQGTIKIRIDFPEKTPLEIPHTIISGNILINETTILKKFLHSILNQF